MYEIILTTMGIVAFFMVPVWMCHIIHDAVTPTYDSWFPKMHKSLFGRFTKSFTSWGITVILVLLLVAGFSTLIGPV